MSAIVYDKSSNYVLGRRILDKDSGTASFKATGNSALNSTFQAVKDRAAAEAQLQTFSAGYYTNARLATMTLNDLIYALRVAYDSASIK